MSQKMCASLQDYVMLVCSDINKLNLITWLKLNYQVTTGKILFSLCN